MHFGSYVYAVENDDQNYVDVDASDVVYRVL